MHDLALYRKYRPKTFGEVLGQDHIVKVLESSVETNKVSHAYLFVGSRGTGKTSVARIFAKEIGVSENDLYEIDAASNRGIEDIRALRDGARVLPFDSKYKVYIIDEVHMLSKDAWGALLKTLEEPPKHVIFILATTEVHKVPSTIVSRCQIIKTVNREQSTVNSAEIENFLSMTPSLKLALFDKIKDRAKAIEFIESLIFFLHNTGDLTNMELLLKTRACLKANGNVNLHLLNLVTQYA